MEMDIAPGTVVDEKFELICQLGAGAYGTIFKARHVHLERLVALKVLHADTIDDKDALARFHREARIISSLQHENICRSFGFGVWQSLPYMALEFLPGRSLQSLLHDNKQLAWNETHELFRQICSGLQRAHDQGVVHRDLKPSNIFIVEDLNKRTVKLIDFGLAKQTDTVYAMSQKLTETGTTVGTCHYMSPEQCVGKSADARSDVYSLGCILYECLAGKPPFDADNGVAVMYMHVHDAPPLLVAPQLPAVLKQNLQSLIEMAMMKEPDKRVQSCLQFINILDELIKNPSKRIPSGAHELSPARALRPSKLRALLVLASLMCLAAIASAFYLQHRRSEGPELQTPRDEMKTRQAPPSIESDLEKADSIQMTGDWTGALQAWNSVSTKPQFKTGSQYNIANAYIRMAECYANLGDFANCDRMRNMAMQYKTTSPPIAPDSLSLARIEAVKLLHAGKQDKAIDVLLSSMKDVRHLQTINVLRNANMLIRLCPGDSKHNDRIQHVCESAVLQVEDPDCEANLLNVVAQYAYAKKEYRRCRLLMQKEIDLKTDKTLRISALFVIVDCCCKQGDVDRAQLWLNVYRKRYLDKDKLSSMRLELTQAAIDATAGHLDEAMAPVLKWQKQLRDPQSNPDHVAIRAIDNIRLALHAAGRKGEASVLDALYKESWVGVDRFAKAQQQLID